VNSRILLLAAVALAAPLAAEAQSYRCIGADGKRYYGSTVPRPCYGLPVEELNAQGRVVKRIDPAADEKARLAKQAEEKNKRDHEAAERETQRRNHALLATYTSAKDIDEARKRALAENSKAVREVERRIEAIRMRQGGYEKELAGYKGGEAPAKLREDMRAAENDLQAHERLLETKKRETEAINARYDEDRKDYLAITGRR
jgi:hypothetical protein